MSTKEMIEELQKLGYEVESRKRTDGGYIITKINGKKFTGAKGNAYARSLLGTELSKARSEQLSFNVEKYIKDTKKPKEAIDEELNKQLKKVQRTWRKMNVKARITKKKLRWHLKQGGRKEALDYLEKMQRYGRGYAYEENVLYLAKYIEDTIPVIKDKELANATQQIAQEIRQRSDLFKEEWISDIYSYWYEVNESAQKTGIADNEIVSKALIKTTIKIR